jgi:hypothetical protein
MCVIRSPKQDHLDVTLEQNQHLFFTILMDRTFRVRGLLTFRYENVCDLCSFLDPRVTWGIVWKDKNHAVSSKEDGSTKEKRQTFVARQLTQIKDSFLINAAYGTQKVTLREV